MSTRLGLALGITLATAVATWWLVEAQGAGGERTSRVVKLAVDAEGARKPQVERRTEDLFLREPAPPSMALAERAALLHDHIEPMLHRELRHRGVVPDILFPDRYQAIKEMGESNLDGALPWDTVRPVEFNTYFPIKDILTDLQVKHDERVANDPDFIYLAEQIERSREMRERTLLSLNESTVRKERDDNRLAEFNANNMRLFLKGLPMEEWTEPTEEELDPDAVAAVTPEETDEEEANQEDDPLLVESSYILIDMAQMLGSPMTADAVSTSGNLNASNL